MQKILRFFSTYKHWLLFIVMEAIALVVLFNEGLYQRTLGISTTNAVVGRMNSALSEGRSYVNLRQENKMLLERIAALEGKNLQLRQTIDFATADTLDPRVFIPDSIKMLMPTNYEFVTARIVSAKGNNHANHLVIDKGRRHGIRQDMAVMSASGVVGIVASVSDSYAVVITLLNPKLNLSCRIKGSNYTGSISSEDPRDPSLMVFSNLPKHAQYEVGDTVLTSGYSYTFPPNLMVGRIEESSLKESSSAKAHGISNAADQSSFSAAKVRLEADVSRLTYVYVLQTPIEREAETLEDSAIMRYGR